MAVANYSPVVPNEPKPALPDAQPSNYQGLTYDNNHTPVVSLLSYTEGAPWTVKAFYRQVLGKHNDLKEIDPALSPTFQSYNRIDQLELRVQQDLTGQTDATKQFTSVEGRGLVYGFVIPNVNDYFIASTSYQREALFRVTAVDRLTWRRESVHGIQYSMVDYTDNVRVLIDDLERKVTGEYVFARDRLVEGLAPILRTADYAIINDLRQERKRLGQYYINTFTINSTRTLNVPGQKAMRIYDSFLVDFVVATFGFIDFPEMLRVTQLPKDGDYFLGAPQFWTAIFKRDRNEILYGNQKMGLASTSAFPKNSHLKTLFSARMDYIIYPINPDTSMSTGFDLKPIGTCGELKTSETVNALGQTLSVAERSYSLLDKLITAYSDISPDGFYVLSEAFYNNDRENMTLIELMTTDYLNGSTLDLKQLSFLVSLYPKMERLTQFYLGPLIMCLLRYADQRAYS